MFLMEMLKKVSLVAIMRSAIEVSIETYKRTISEGFKQFFYTYRMKSERTRD